MTEIRVDLELKIKINTFLLSVYFVERQIHLKSKCIRLKYIYPSCSYHSNILGITKFSKKKNYNNTLVVLLPR